MEFHEEELQVMKILSIFSYISILLAGLGLFGLAWFSVENRRKEISLRKINGASEKPNRRVTMRPFYQMDSSCFLHRGADCLLLLSTVAHTVRL